MKFLAANIFVLLILATGFTQGQEKRATYAPCKYIAQSGWRVPCLGEVVEIKPLGDSIVENVIVHAKKHEFGGEILIGFEGCRPVGKETKEAREKPFAVREVFTYEANGKTFAYHIRFTIIEVGPNDRIIYTGAQYNAYYFDEDADGTFKIRCRAKGLEDLPAWVKSTALSNKGMNRTR